MRTNNVNVVRSCSYENVQHEISSTKKYTIGDMDRAVHIHVYIALYCSKIPQCLSDFMKGWMTEAY